MLFLFPWIFSKLLFRFITCSHSSFSNRVQASVIHIKLRKILLRKSHGISFVDAFRTNQCGSSSASASYKFLNSAHIHYHMKKIYIYYLDNLHIFLSNCQDFVYTLQIVKSHYRS